MKRQAKWKLCFSHSLALVEVAELLSRVDADGDGTLVWQEFLHLMRQVQDREDWKWVLHEQEMASKAQE